MYEISVEGISSGATHFDKRSACLDRLFALSAGLGLGLRPWMAMGLQKVARLGWTSAWSLVLWDNK